MEIMRCLRLINFVENNRIGIVTPATTSTTVALAIASILLRFMAAPFFTRI
jgi:hypothetical protein